MKHQLHVHVIKANLSFYSTLFFFKFDGNKDFTLISLEYQTMLLNIKKSTKWCLYKQTTFIKKMHTNASSHGFNNIITNQLHLLKITCTMIEYNYDKCSIQ